MIIEPYQYLIEHAEEYGYPRAHVGPASVDLSLDSVKRFDEAKGQFVTMLGMTYTFEPGQFYLPCTTEAPYVPPTHAGFVLMRSSQARKGLSMTLLSPADLLVLLSDPTSYYDHELGLHHLRAGYVDPGFRGQLTLEMVALRHVTLNRWERIVQLIYVRLTEATEMPYAGRYLNQRGPTEAYKP